MGGHCNPAELANFQRDLLSRLNDSTFREVFASVRDFIDFDATHKMQGPGIDFINRFFLSLISELLQLSLRERSMNEDNPPSAAFNSYKWKKDLKMRKPIRQMLAKFPLQDDFGSDAITIESFVLYDIPSNVCIHCAGVI